MAAQAYRRKWGLPTTHQTPGAMGVGLINDVASCHGGGWGDVASGLGILPFRARGDPSMGARDPPSNPSIMTGAP
jgi:hypothetical protein